MLLRGKVDSLFSVAARQMVCGGLGAVVDIIVFQVVLYTGILGLHGAVNAGFIAAFFIVYYAHKHYTFRHIQEYTMTSLRQILVFLGTALVSLGLGHIIVRFLVMALDFIPVIARAVSIAIIFFYSLFVTRRLVFVAADQKINTRI